MYEYLDRRYALALYEVAEKNGKIDQYIEELKQIVDLIKNNAELSKIVHHPQITTSKKKKIFKEILGNCSTIPCLVQLSLKVYTI